MPNGIVISTVSQIKSVPIVGKFVSNIFKKPQTKDGFAKFKETEEAELRRRAAAGCGISMCELKFINRQPMKANEKQICISRITEKTINWTKAQKQNLQDELKNIQVIPDPPPVPQVEVHTVSASYSPQAQTQTIAKSRDVQEVVQAGMTGISGIPIYIWAGIGALLILPLLRGGKK